MEYPIEQYWQMWQNHSWKNPTLLWKPGWIENGYCPECLLCCGPQKGDNALLMSLLPHQIHQGMEEIFYMHDETHALLDRRGCKALGEHGCRLERDQRPVACGFFPIVIINMDIYAY